MDRIRFVVKSKLGKEIMVTERYWSLIVKIKHPIIKDYEKEVKETIEEPEVIRMSRKDSDVFLHYKRHGKFFVCVLVKHLNGEGFIITAYLADKIKKGKIIWQREA